MDDGVDYNPDATEPGDCITLHTWGCMDTTAFNYDADATISDLNSPCVTTITLEDDAGDGWGNSHVGIKQGDLQWIFTVGPGEFSQSWDLVLDSDEEVMYTTLNWQSTTTSTRDRVSDAAQLYYYNQRGWRYPDDRGNNPF